MTETLEQRIEQLVETFDSLDDWELRYGYIIELGKALAPLKPEEMTEGTRVLGCASRVWLVIDNCDDGLLRFRGDSDAFIVRGLIAILIELLFEATLVEVSGFALEPLMQKLQLSEALSSQRTNGLMSIVGRLKALAQITTPHSNEPH